MTFASVFSQGSTEQKPPEQGKNEISSQEKRTSLPVYQLLSKRNIFSP
ncbi:MULTISPECIES: hypothetical protein [Klebsiella]|nr:hypothetical protein [Klebsiella spallanzanii]